MSGQRRGPEKIGQEWLVLSEFGLFQGIIISKAPPTIEGESVFPSRCMVAPAYDGWPCECGRQYVVHIGCFFSAGDFTSLKAIQARKQRN